MKETSHRFGMASVLIALLLVSAIAPAQEMLRIDGSSDARVEQSYRRMLDSLDRDRQIKLVTAVLRINMIGVSSAREAIADPGLQSPGPVRIRDRIAGLTAAEIIALANKTAPVRTVVDGEKPGVPADLLTPLGAGKPAYSLASSKWHVVSDINGFIKEETFEFGPGGTLEIEPPSTAGTSTWEQSADEVRLFINDRYAVSRGKFVDADHMRGTAGNTMGTTWTWTAERR
jgi:hypothetical protein